MIKLIDRKDPLNLHSFTCEELLKKKENTWEDIAKQHLNNVYGKMDSSYVDSVSVKERKGENAEG